MEAQSLIFAGILIWVSVLVQHVTNMKTRGAQFLMSDRSAPLSEDGLTGRATRTLRNNIESIAMYVPIAAVAVAMDVTTPVTYWSAITWMVVRTTFSIGYWLKINMLRSLSWLVGMAAIAAFAVALAVQAA
ncbi:MAPEG family protein [Novosphingobium lentum]|uniref:MAPEG family protein n=1 Tax=Novosphingobium lentum TaxID=145287 RepID=UPI0014703ED9|nr:MAPEG family protein [Novosphingobium lentum]